MKQPCTIPPNSSNVPLSSWKGGKNWDGTQRDGGSKVAPLPTDAEIVEACHSV